MSITVEMPAQEIAALKQLTRLDNDGEAIVQAAREFLRLSRLRELKAASGTMEFALGQGEALVAVAKERQEALRQLIGSCKADHPPDDEEVDRMLEQERMRKYG